MENNIRPIWNGYHMPRYREENDGIYSIPMLGSIDIFGVNKPAIELLKLCDGAHKFNDICEILDQTYGKINRKKALEMIYILRDIRAIQLMGKRIEKENTGMQEIKVEAYKAVSISLKKATIRIKAMFKDSSYQDKKRLIIVSSLENDYFDVLSLRERITNNSQKAFGFYKNGIIVAILILDFSPFSINKKIAVISEMICEDYLNNGNTIESLINYATKSIENKGYVGIRISVPFSQSTKYPYFNNKYFLAKLYPLGFICEGTLKNEILDGIDIQIWRRNIKNRD